MSDEEHVSIWMRPERVERSGPGRRPGFSRAQIVERAVAIADADGLEAATMRRIADAMGTGAMSLYRYIPKRDDLIDLMLDTVMAELELPPRPTGDWRSDLTLASYQIRAVGLRHPWQVALASRRPTLGPSSLRVYEFMLSALDGFGLDIDEIASLVGMLSDYVNSAVHREIGWLDEARRTGMDMRRWMTAYVGPHIRRVLDSGEYPMFNRSIMEARVPHLPPEDRFRYGLDRVLDGIAAGLPG
ncbi:TetR family transcriptional regulator [Acrocarpospora corrugata]|uniref:TetR family transcriptional regulator n=1 Tax=Acrocarpospora corrugata TaxID=35763 RepID=A0A5M3VZY7_9ACTN|nr:TetR/AcrR family transcriptional regulator [Acrocarpospora corrugata]GES01569.1 TetR family transcriptional regulator [Acrocarpospora corrugata]